MKRYTQWKENYRSKLLFSEYYRPAADSIIEALKAYKKQGKTIAIWGGGLKGNSFLHMVDKKGEYITYVIDIKESKAGKGIVGRNIISCYDLADKHIDVIFMMSQKHFVQNYNILKDTGMLCTLHDVDEIVKRNLSASAIMNREDMEQNTEENEKLTQEIQKELLPLLHEVKRLCDEKGIPYFLCAGSALGAVRHEGFIPWDDDIDIGMLRADYITFLEAARKDLREGFLLIDANDTPDYYVGHAKVFRDNTALVNRETSHLRTHHGFYLDIFPFDTIPQDNDLQEKMYTRVRAIKDTFTNMKKKSKYDGKNPIKKYFANPNYYRLRLKSPKWVFRQMNEALMQYQDSDSGLVADMFAPYNKRLYFKVSDIYPPKLMRFEDDVYPVPCNADAYLTTMYGDYMSLPPKDKRFVKHDIICFDTEHNYCGDEKWMRKWSKKRSKKQKR